MAVPGFPDYSRTSSQNSPPLVDDSRAFGVGYQSTVFDTQGYQYINLLLDVSTGTVGYQVNIQFSALPNMSEVVYQEDVTWGVQGLGMVQIIAPARYCVLTLSQSAAAAGDNFHIVAFGTNAQTPPKASSNSFGVVLRAVQNLATGGAQTFKNNFPSPGRAIVTFFASVSANYFIQLQYLQFGVTQNDFSLFYGAKYGQAGVEEIMLPAQPIAIILHNTDPGTQVVSCYVTQA